MAADGIAGIHGRIATRRHATAPRLQLLEADIHFRWGLSPGQFHPDGLFFSSNYATDFSFIWK